MAVSWTEHKDKKILYVDYRGCKNDDELLKVLQEHIDIEKKAPSGLLVLANYTGAYVGLHYMQEVKKYGQELRKSKSPRTGVVGVDGLKKLAFSGYMAFTGDKNTKAFDSENEAKDWLVS